jgi:hypothetical protein
MTASPFSPAMHKWARHHAIRLADKFFRDLQRDSDNPRRYFETNCGLLLVTPELRAVAEPAYHERIAELEGGRG